MASSDAKSRRSLRLRVTLLAVAAVAAAWGVAALVAYVRVVHEADELLDAYLVQMASVLQARTSDEDIDESELEHAPELHKYARRVLFQVWDRDGRLRLHSVNAPDDRRLSGRDEGFDDVDVGGRRLRVFSSRDREHRVLVQVGEPRRARDEIAQGVGRALALPLAVALPALALALWLSIGAGLRPLSTLSREIGARDPDNLASVPADVPRELVPLVRSLNRLLDRVRVSLDRERRFTADAAHELRTPIAALRAQAQVARQARADAERDRALAGVLAGCDRAARLVDQMLTLARLDPLGGLPASDARCDLADVARAVVAEHAQQALDRHVEIGYEGTTALVSGDRALLAILTRNLVDNAIRHTPAGASVRVTTAVQPPSSVVLGVTDEGPGVPPEARARLGERFFRLLGDEAPGSGLGLSIVRRIAELHGASLAFAAGNGGRGLEVRVSFPAAP